MLEIGRRVASGEPATLPEWNDFSVYLLRGVKAFVVGLVYALPIIILGLCPFTLSLIGGGGQDANALAGIASMISLLISCVIFVYVIFLAFVQPVALMRFTMHGDDIKAGLAFGEVFRTVQEHLGTYLMVVLGTLIASLIAGAGTIACGIGLLFTVPYAQAIVGHLYGQAYVEATGGTPLGGTVPPPAAPAAPTDWTG